MTQNRRSRGTFLYAIVLVALFLVLGSLLVLYWARTIRRQDEYHQSISGIKQSVVSKAVAISFAMSKDRLLEISRSSGDRCSLLIEELGKSGNLLNIPFASGSVTFELSTEQLVRAVNNSDNSIMLYFFDCIPATANYRSRQQHIKIGVMNDGAVVDLLSNPKADQSLVLPCALAIDGASW